MAELAAEVEGRRAPLETVGDVLAAADAAARVSLPFTRREHEITNLLSRGVSNRDIAEATSLSIRTVEGHM